MKTYILVLLKTTLSFIGIMIAVLLAWNNVQAQTGFVSTSGSSCVGGEMTVYGSGCIGGVYEFQNAYPGVDYEKIYNPNDKNDEHSKTVKWLRPVSNVRAVYCQYMTEPFNVVGTPAMPSVTATASKTSTCSSSSAIVTFTSQNTNAGASPYYRWYVNGGAAISEGYDKDKLQLPESYFHNGDQVMVQVTSQVQCLGPYAVNSPKITMNVTEASVVSLTINTNRTAVCQGQGVAFWVEDPKNVGSSPRYQWYVNGSERSSDTPNPQLGPTWLTFDHWNYGDNAVVTCKVTSSQTGCMANSQATSNAITVPLKAKQSFSAGIKVLPERQPMNYCEDDVSFQATVMPEATGIYQVYWYKNGQSVGTNNSPTYKPAAYAQGDVVSVNVIANDDGCLNNTSSTFSTAGTPIHTVVRPAPPMARDTLVRWDASHVLTADGAIDGQSYNWYSDNDILLGSDLSFTTPILTALTTNYKVRTYNTSVPECMSAATPLIVTTNHAPVVDLGPDRDLELPVAGGVITIAASVTDVDGTITSTQWRQIQLSSNITGTETTTVKLSRLREGYNVLRLEATDNHNEIGYDEITIRVRNPPNNWNYIREENMLHPGVTNEASVPDLPIGERTEKTTYFDGIGRPVQVVGRQESPGKLDVVTPVGYDGFGREYRKYLPFTAGTTGFYRNDSEIIDADHDYTYKGDAAAFYSGSDMIPADSRPYTETVYEFSALNRPVAEYGPGADWGPDGNDKPVRVAELSNIHGTAPDQERIIAWKINDNGALAVRNAVDAYIENGGYYSTGQLSIRQTADEQGHIVREYTDKNGVLVLKRVQAIETTPAINNDDHWAETYYIYDDFGRLAMVLPPQGTKYAKQALSQH